MSMSPHYNNVITDAWIHNVNVLLNGLTDIKNILYKYLSIQIQVTCCIGLSCVISVCTRYQAAAVQLYLVTAA